MQEPVDTLISVVVPAHDEQDNLRPLVEKIRSALDPSGLTYEVVIVDDGSTDDTARVIAELVAATAGTVRGVRMAATPTGRNGGQSAALHAGIRRARGKWIAMLDADLQNDPADLRQMFQVIRARAPAPERPWDAGVGAVDMVQGDRSGARKDSWVRRQGSIIGRWFRRLILDDTIRDTGCSLRLMRREIALLLPLELAGMHRFIPAMAQHMGWTVVEVAVNHRPRHAGRTKYGMGIKGRAIPALIDCFVVRYMRKRRRPVRSVMIEPAAGPEALAAPARNAKAQVLEEVS